MTITSDTACVHPVFELDGAPRVLDHVELDGRTLGREAYAWDGHTLWLDATLRGTARLRLSFHP